ncbi:hypothetical protein HMPREF2854_02610 [Actinomyces sp. HMSC075B09]|nr:hypothetical protein [Gleimia europaea]OFJ62732.1 hypothetical protein HMPREF2854_02610 [Actinomyces sp. HMSC075B09]
MSADSTYPYSRLELSFVSLDSIRGISDILTSRGMTTRKQRAGGNVGEILAGLGVLLGGLAKLIKELRRKDNKTN